MFRLNKNSLKEYLICDIFLKYLNKDSKGKSNKILSNDIFSPSERKKREEDDGGKNINHTWIETADFTNQKAENQTT